jgi:hypothetical protein
MLIRKEIVQDHILVIHKASSNKMLYKIVLKARHNTMKINDIHVIDIQIKI